MRKILFILPIIMITAQSVRADDYNPFFGDARHQIAFNVGLGVESGFLTPPPARWVPFTEFNLQYSVPSTFFYFPARFSINATQTVGYGKGYGWDWRDFSIPIIYLTEDVMLFDYKNAYIGAGAGAGFQIKENARIGSKFIFTLKVFIGYKFTDRMAGEIFVQHFSNGNTAPENNSYGFWGMGVTYNF